MAPRRRVLVPRILSSMVALWGALVAIGTLSCGAKGPSGPPNIVLISIDSLRADHLHAYGYSRPTTPTLDALAAQGTRLTSAWANSPWTLPSHVTMLSGTLPYRHGVVDDSAKIRPSLPLLAPILKAHGYATAGVVSGTFVSSRFGFDRGFDRFEEFGQAKNQRSRQGDHGEAVTDGAARLIAEMAETGDRPFFLFVHYFDCHYDYDPPAPYNKVFDEDSSVVTYKTYQYFAAHPLPASALEHVIAQYDEAILYVDSQIGRLLKTLDEQGRRRTTYIVVTADHGEEFFEHGSWGHAHGLHSEMLRVPLIIAGPGVPQGRVCKDLVSLEDVAPTLLDLVSLPRVPDWQGTSFAGPVKGLQAAEPGTGSGPGPQARADKTAVTGPAPSGGPTAGSNSSAGRFVLTDTSRFSSNKVGAVTGGQSLIVDIEEGRTELFDIDRDPEERKDLSLTNPADVSRLFRSLMGKILDTVQDRWVLSWSEGASGSAAIEGFLVPAGPLGPDEKPSLDRLKRWQSNSAAGEVRLASIPPDAPVSFDVMCGLKTARCATVAGTAADQWPRDPRADAVEASGAGRIRFRVDPIADGVKLRATGASTASSMRKGPAFAVRIESRTVAPVPSELTPEEIERLNSLGYIH